MLKVEIYEKGITYHSALTLYGLYDAELRELAKILQRLGHSYRVTPIEDEPTKEGVNTDDF